MMNDSSDSSLHYETSDHGKGIHLLQIHEFEKISTPITIATWFLVIIIAKILFHRFSKISSILPDSAMLLVLGGIFGAVVHFIYPSEEFYLKPEWFFLYLLPPIALEAGFFLPNKDFFHNLGTISTYAVFGTIWNIASIGKPLLWNYLNVNFLGFTLFLFRDYFHGSPTALQLLLFATLISAVDPVAVICVFEEIHVNQLLYICVFGESLLNDAVTIVLYHTFNAMTEIGAENMLPVDYVTATSSFFVVSFGGILVGAIWAIITGLTTRLGVQVNVVQPLICFIFPYMSYLIAERYSLSSILAIVVCGLMMKQYIVANISKKSLVTVKYFMKTASSSCEALIFVYLGMSSISKNHDVDYLFIVITLVSCLVYRFIGVVFLTYLLNFKRQEKIGFVDQFIMGYGGIRGAVCYGLVMSLDSNVVPCKNMFATTTIIVILFTVFLQGGTIKWLVKYLKVKQSENRKKALFEMITENVNNHLMGGIESIAGLHGHYWFRLTLERLNQKYIQPYLMVKQVDKGMKLVEHNEEIQVKEAVSYLRKYGSFAGMPTVQSKSCLVQSQSVANGFQFGPSSNGLLTPPKIIIPRNISMRTFVQEKLDRLNSPPAMYSRHFLDTDLQTRPNPFIPQLDLLHCNDDRDEHDFIESDAGYKTFPYSKSSQKDMVISTFRKSSKPNLMPPTNGQAPGHTAINIDSMDLCIPKKNDGIRQRPRFMITSDSTELSGSQFSPEEANSLDSSPIHIGRFEIKTDEGSKHPVSYHRSHRAGTTTTEETVSLMPIQEQDERERGDTITSLSQV
uniref:Sodium/hydrogen exchanger n=1 Tax=Acrobeloides nanus TaxID=290746 RepID=A0A914E8X8_9BILA